MTITMAQISRLYDIEPVDYGEEREGNGLLISTGAGLMMSVMDACPSMRWCLDTATARGKRLGDFMIAAERVAKPVALAAWFSVTDPAAIRVALNAMEHPVVYTGGTPIGFAGECSELGAFIARVNVFARAESTLQQLGR